MLVSGINALYENYSELIERVVSSRRAQYKFPGTNPDDMSQDIRIICFDALAKFDLKRIKNSEIEKPLYAFLVRCVDNALYNKFRGVYLDNNPPCIRCEHYIKKTKECAIDEVGCDRIVKYRQNMSQKRGLFAPSQFGLTNTEDGDSIEYEPPVGSLTGTVDFHELLKSRLDPKVYEKLMSGEKISHKLRKQIKDILGDEVY